MKQQRECSFYTEKPPSSRASSESQQPEKTATVSGAAGETAAASARRARAPPPSQQREQQPLQPAAKEEEQAAESDNSRLSTPPSLTSSPSELSPSDSEDCSAPETATHQRHRATEKEDQDGRAAAAATAVAATAGHRQELQHSSLQKKPEGMQLLPPPAYVAPEQPPSSSSAAEKAQTALLFTAHTPTNKNDNKHASSSGPASLLRRRRTSPAALLAAAVHSESNQYHHHYQNQHHSNDSSCLDANTAASRYSVSPFFCTAEEPLVQLSSHRGSSAGQSKKVSVRSSSSSSQPVFLATDKLCAEDYSSVAASTQPTANAAAAAVGGGVGSGKLGSARRDSCAASKTRGGRAREVAELSSAAAAASAGAGVADSASRLDDISVRPFRPEDADAVRQLCYRHFRSLALPSVFFWLCHHSVDVVTLFLISICFLPLKGVLLSALVFFGYLLLRGVWEFELYIRRDCPDLHDIQRSYMQNKGSGFWVAERFEPVKKESGTSAKLSSHDRATAAATDSAVAVNTTVSTSTPLQ